MRHLATELQKNGVETYLDQWHVHPGMDLAKYMATHIREADFVLLICTPTFAEKANAGEGGVGYETSIVTGEMFDTMLTRKFVPLLRKGIPKEALPSYLRSKLFIDLRKDHLFDSKLEELLRHLHQEPKHTPPPLGSKPKFSS